MNLKPKKNKYQVIQSAFMNLMREEKRYRNFFTCNENEKMREQHDKGICPVCGKPIGFGNPAELHHITYEHQCHYAYEKPRCELCFEKHRNCFEACKSKLVYVHPWCHEKIHEFDRKENDDEE